MKSKFLFIMTIIAGTLLFQSSAFAYDFSRSFSEIYGLNSIINAYSPAHDTSGNDAFVAVNSKTNQPRTTGTSPHVGTDISMAAGRNVYAIYSGKVVSKNTDTSSQLGNIIINLDTNNNGTPDGFYIKYLHIVPSSSLSVGSSVSRTTVVGTIDTYKVFPPHLHFARTDSTDSISYKLYNLYRHTSISTWNNGESLDYLAGDSIVGSSVYITGYTMDDGAWEDLSTIYVYYKIGSTGTWSSTPKQMTKFNTYGRWKYDFSAVASSGQTVYYYLAGIRADMSSTSDNWGLWPQYYTHPPKDPSSFSWSIQYKSFVMP
ncbi:M23 family metallopeptidase [Paenibacillus caui]|uniref:peptidoglycan DD-metalloendopeptidase family protein n=1 Tax=Paenibacillus caui TaxID=2873927 RepID=UPI001CAA0220|nr:M23 family metallopeptidase [Paenibacillus caui]